LWLAVDLPELPLQALLSGLCSTQREHPVALMARARLEAVNAVAVAAGLRPGMKRATALALAPQAMLVAPDPARSAQALQTVVHLALGLTPSVCLHGPQTVLLEVAASLRLFGGLARLQARLLAGLSRLALVGSVASAPTATGAAWLARHHATQGQGAAPLPPVPDLAALRARIDALPLYLLAAAGPHLSTWQSLGLQCMADLRRLPRDGLTRRFGAAVLRELDAARGEAPEAHEWLTLPECFEGRLELLARADTAEQVLGGALILLERLLTWARARHGRVACLQLAMLHEPRHRADDHTPARTELTLALASPENSLRHIGSLLRERLAAHALPAPTLELQLRCNELVLQAPPSGELFPTRASEQEGLLRLLERLQARLGPDRVQQVLSVSDHRPEHATRLQPLALTGKPLAGAASHDTAARGVDGSRSPLGPTRPVWLLPQPQPLRLRQHAPLLDDHPLQLLAGPERIEAGWWDGAPVVRDYFVAQAHDRSVVWIYRSRLPPLHDGEADARGHPHDQALTADWFLHGRFA
jgi:protein ImuB